MEEQYKRGRVYLMKKVIGRDNYISHNLAYKTIVSWEHSLVEI